MTNLTEIASWDAAVFQLETSTPALAGPGGVMNAQAQALANRTAYLKQEVELRAPLASPALTGNPTAPTQAVGNNSTRLATTAFVLNQAGDTAPLGDAATASIGTSLRFARQDHRHPLVGGVNSGDISISKSNPRFILAKTASGELATVYGRLGSTQMWGLVLGNATANAGSNAGSDFTLDRYDDDGIYAGSTLFVRRSDGFVGLGNTNPAARLDVAGVIHATGAVQSDTGFVNTSDRRVKENALPIADALAKLATIQAYTYNRIGDPETRDAGVMAQDVREVLPEAVGKLAIAPTNDPEGEPTLTLSYSALTALILAATNELRQRVEALEKGPA